MRSQIYSSNFLAHSLTTSLDNRIQMEHRFDSQLQDVSLLLSLGEGAGSSKSSWVDLHLQRIDRHEIVTLILLEDLLLGHKDFEGSQELLSHFTVVLLFLQQMLADFEVTHRPDSMLLLPLQHHFRRLFSQVTLVDGSFLVFNHLMQSTNFLDFCLTLCQCRPVTAFFLLLQDYLQRQLSISCQICFQ